MITEQLILSTIMKNVYYRERVFPYLKAGYFDEDSHQRLFSSISRLLDNKATVLDMATVALEFSDEDLLHNIFILDFPNENIEYLITETEKWVKDQSIKNAVMASADILVTKKDPIKIRDMVTEALAVSFDKDLGLDYVSDVEYRLERYSTQSKSLATGYTMLDYYTHGGPKGKTLTVYMAASNLGKTMMMCNLDSNFNKAGFNGIYLTLELDRDIIARRKDSINTGIPYFSLLENKENVLKFFNDYKGGNTFIKNYPPSKASTANLRTYLKELEIHKKYKPDYIMVDYINLMRQDSPSKNDNMYQIYFDISKELRELAIELDCPIITATQVQREAYGKANVGMEHSRGSMGIIENADLVIALTQVEDQEAEHLITQKILKNRLGRRAGKFESQFDPETLRVREILTEDDRELLATGRVKLNKSEELEEDENSIINSLLKEDNTSGGMTDFS